MEEVLDVLFNENLEDINKIQDYKDNFKTFDLDKNYYLLEMYNRQKQLQEFLGEKGKTNKFPDNFYRLEQKDVQLAIYHLFCMEIEYEELKVEIEKFKNKKNLEKKDLLSVRFELIDMFFFMFNVGIYTGIDFNFILNRYSSFLSVRPIIESDNIELKKIDFSYIDETFSYLRNYIDKLPWKAWKEYDYSKKREELSTNKQLDYYCRAIAKILDWSYIYLHEDLYSLFQLYMNKWEENHRRQSDIESGYIL